MLETTINTFKTRMTSEVKKCVASHDALRVSSRKGNNFIVIAEEDWRSIQETIFLNQIPGFVDSVHKANDESLDEGVRWEDIEW